MAVNLDALLQDAGAVTVGGVEHPVRPIDGVGYELYEQMAANPAAVSVSDLYRLAQRCCPTLTPEALGSLTAQQVGAILKIAAGQVAAAEAEVAAVVGKSPGDPEDPPST